MYKFRVETVINHKVRTLTFAFTGNTESDARKACEKFLSENKMSYYVIRGEGKKIQ